ncbi:MAG: hypothetical protein JNM84_11860 [Planctomycetes bacterium]|nr:hypothetical protein [Planctomycetota bacterium]
MSRARLLLAAALLGAISVAVWWLLHSEDGGAPPARELASVSDARVPGSALEPVGRSERQASEAPTAPSAPLHAPAEPGPDRQAMLRRTQAWLLSQQDEDGGFGMALEGTSASFRREGWTGLALLALLSDGRFAQDPKSKAAIERGLEFLTQRMQGEGANAGLIGRADDGAALFNHGFAATALLEGAQLLERKDLTENAQQAATYLVRGAADPAATHLGRDPFTTVWATLALSSGREAGLALDPALLERTREALQARTDPETGAVGREVPGFDAATPIGGLAHDPESGSQSATAAALFSRILLGEAPREGSILERQAEFLAAHPPRASADGSSHDVLYWQLGTLATLQAGGTSWSTWSAELERSLGALYRSSGEPFATDGPFARDLGALGVASSALFSLQLLERVSRLSR